MLLARNTQGGRPCRGARGRLLSLSERIIWLFRCPLHDFARSQDSFQEVSCLLFALGGGVGIYVAFADPRQKEVKTSSSDP